MSSLLYQTCYFLLKFFNFLKYDFCKTLLLPLFTNTDKVSNQLSEGKPTKAVFLLFCHGICISI